MAAARSRRPSWSMSMGELLTMPFDDLLRSTQECSTMPLGQPAVGSNSTWSELSGLLQSFDPFRQLPDVPSGTTNNMLASHSLTLDGRTQGRHRIQTGFPASSRLPGQIIPGRHDDASRGSILDTSNHSRRQSVNGASHGSSNSVLDALQHASSGSDSLWDRVHSERQRAHSNLRQRALSAPRQRPNRSPYDSMLSILDAMSDALHPSNQASSVPRWARSSSTAGNTQSMPANGLHSNRHPDEDLGWFLEPTLTQPNLPANHHASATPWQPSTGRRTPASVQAPASDYEALLVLDQNNVQRAVRADVVAALPQRQASRMDKDKKCSICMDGFTPGKQLSRLPCMHEFCQSCIEPWLSSHDTCPVCRWQFPSRQTRLVGM